MIDLAIRLVALVVVPRDRLPTAAMAWLLAIFFIPVIGVLLFLLIGNPKLPEKRRVKQKEMDVVIARESEGLAEPSSQEGWPPWLDPVVTLTRNMTSMPIVGGNSARLISDYSGSLAAMAEEIDAATSYVHVEFYIFSLDPTTAPFFDALESAVARGVTVRVLLDHWASSHSAGYKETLERLEQMGADWQLMLPVQPLKGRYQRLDLRNHRKLLVVDGQAAFVGSQNLIDRSYNKKKNLKLGLKWQELMCRLEGPVVASVDMVFATDWLIESGEDFASAPKDLRAEVVAAPSGNLDCQVVPSGPGIRRGEQPAAVPHPAVRRPVAGHHHESLLRAGRLDAPWTDGGDLPRSAGRPVRLRDRRPGAGVARATLLLRRTAARRRAHLSATRLRTSCMRSTSASTTTSRSSARATWT